MSRTVTVTFSDTEIRRQAEQADVRELRDPRHPTLRFRFGKQRARGSWFLVVRNRWRKLGGFPGLTTKAVTGALPAAEAKLIVDAGASVLVDGFRLLGEVFTWYEDRVSRDSSLSAKRKTTAKSAITRHLIPKLGAVAVEDLNRGLLDKQLMWPLQEHYSLGYVRSIFVLLLDGLRKAKKLDLVARNPMADIRFSDFSRAKIRSKTGRLRGVQLSDVLAGLATDIERNPSDCVLALMMLCHGTRVGETRRARWAHISLPDRIWYIPAENTKTRSEHTLPLTDQVCTLLTGYRELQQARGYDGPCLFPNRAGKSLSESQACAVFTRLGKGDWTSHDLRKVARTTWAEMGVDHFIGELLINHAMGQNVEAYIQTQAPQLKREALERWHAWLDARGFEVIRSKTFARYENSANAIQPSNGAASSHSCEQ